MDERDQQIVDEVRENFTLKTLQERVWRLEAENNQLKVNNSILQTQYNSQCETQQGILRTYHTQIEEDRDKIDALEAKVARLEQQLEDQKQEFKDDADKERVLWESRYSELQIKKEELEDKLHKVREFQENKDKMEADLAELQQRLIDQNEAHIQEQSAFDRQKAIEKDQIRKDAKASIKEMQSTLKARIQDQLDHYTKQTIMENETLSKEIICQSKETERMMAKVAQLEEQNAQLQRDVRIHRELETELAKRTQRCQKVIKKLQQRQSLESTTANGSRETADISMMEEESRSLSQMASQPFVGVSTEELDRHKRELDALQAKLQTERHDFAAYRRDHQTITHLQDQSTRLIISALYDLKRERESGESFPPPTYDENASYQFATLTSKQKEYFFRMLLEKLNSSMCANCFPTGPAPTTSTASLPPITCSNSGAAHAHEAHGHGHGGAKLSQFLWSVTSTTAASPKGGPPKELVPKGVQTETPSSDPCFKEGLWNPSTRSRHSSTTPNVTASQVMSGVRPWGNRAATMKARGLGVPRIV